MSRRLGNHKECVAFRAEEGMEADRREQVPPSPADNECTKGLPKGDDLQLEEIGKEPFEAGPVGSRPNRWGPASPPGSGMTVSLRGLALLSGCHRHSESSVAEHPVLLA